jgi:hypothetical protein
MCGQRGQKLKQRCVLGIEKRYYDHIAIGMRHVCLYIF